MTNEQLEKELEKFARYIWGLSPHNFFDRKYKGTISTKSRPLDKYKVLDLIEHLTRKIND